MVHDLCMYTDQSEAAVALYLRAFDAELGFNVRNDDGSYFHASIVKDGDTILAVSQSDNWATSGKCMQYCLSFGKENRAALEKAYRALSEDGEVLYPLGPCDWNECMTDLVDRFGVRWYMAL